MDKIFNVTMGEDVIMIGMLPLTILAAEQVGMSLCGWNVEPLSLIPLSLIPLSVLASLSPDVPHLLLSCAPTPVFPHHHSHALVFIWPPILPL